MKFLALAAFATSALAAAVPQSYPCDGNENGCFAQQCTCDRIEDGVSVQDDNLGFAACNTLSNSFPNLQFQIGRGCIDLNGRGVEPTGFNAACQALWGPLTITKSNCLY